MDYDKINPMMYRVFLQDGEEGRGGFEVNSAEILAWTYYNPDYRPSLTEQLRHARRQDEVTLRCLDSQFCSANERKHWLVDNALVFHNHEQAIDKAYDLARQRALDLTKRLSEEKEAPYVFIDVSSRGDIKEADRLSKTIHEVCIAAANPRAVDIGD